MTRAQPDPNVAAGGVGPHGAERVTCTARAKATGLQCQRAPIRGGNVCYVHGGRAPQVRAAAQRRLAAQRIEADVQDAIAFQSREGVRDPIELLARLADEALAMKEALAVRINGLAEIRYSAAGSGTEQLRAEVALYERAMDRAGRFLDLLAKSGFEERRVQLGERQGALVAEVLHRVFNRLDLSDAQRGLLSTVVPEELRRVTVRGEVVR